MALDASAIDEGTMMDRDWYWVFNGLWDKKSTDRCRVTIADTIICSGGEPQQWMFTAKNGVVKRMGKEKVKWPTIREKLIQMQEAHNARWNYMTGQNRSLDYGYVAVCRSGAPGSFEVTRLDRQGFENFFQTEGAELKSKTAILQAYVPVKTAERSANGTVYRTEFEQPRRNKFRLQTYKMVYMTGVEGTVVNEKGVEVPADKCQQALKCTAIGLKEQLNAATMELVRYLEAHKRTHISTLAAEFMVEEVDRRPFLTHCTSVVSASLPKIPKAPASKPNVSRLLSNDVSLSSVDKYPAGEMYDMLEKKKKKHMRRKEDEEVGEPEDRSYIIPFKSVLLARLDDAMATENESPRYAAVRKMAVTAELSKLDPAHFYRQVKVTERYYRTYNLLDKQRQKDVETGKQLVQTRLERMGRKQPKEWWAHLNQIQEDIAATDPAKAVDRHRMDRLCRNLISNQALCDRLCQGVSSIKPDGQLPQLLQQMVNNIVKTIGLYEEPEEPSEWSATMTPPWSLTNDKTRWRRDLSRSFTPSSYGSKTEQEVIEEAEAKIAKVRRKQQVDEEFSRSRSVLKGSASRNYSAARSESAPPVLPAIGASKSRRASGPRLHSRQPLPIVAASPAVTASRSSSYNFPKKLPGTRELRSRQVMDSSTIEYEHLYDNPVAAVEPSGQTKPEVSSNSGALTEDAALFISDQPVGGRYCRFSENMTIKYEIIDGGAGLGSPIFVVALNDFFDSYEKMAKFLSPLLQNAPAGSQGLFFNFPGQAHTEFDEGGTQQLLNNVVLARGFDALLSALQMSAQFAPGAAITTIAVGNGANVLTYC